MSCFKPLKSIFASSSSGESCFYSAARTPPRAPRAAPRRAWARAIVFEGALDARVNDDIAFRRARL